MLLPPLLLLWAAAPQAPAAERTPEEALALAVAAQRTGDKDHRVEFFGIDLNLRERGETPRELEVTLLYDSRRRGSLQLILDDSGRGGVRVEKGYDGERYWLKEQDHEPILLAGRDFARDRELIDDTLGLCEELLLLFDLERLKARTSDLELAQATLFVGGQQRPHEVLRGAISLADRRRRFALWLDRETWLPSRLTLEADDPTVEAGGDEAAAADPEVLLAQEFDLSAYHDFPFLGSDSTQGRLLPRLVREYRRDAEGDRTQVRILELQLVQWRLAPRIRKLEGPR